MKNDWLGGSIPRDNNFDLIRLFAALQVATMHSINHLHGSFPGWAWDILILPEGVPIFFFVSGLLVTSSFARRSLRSYAEARGRRVFPALWLAFLIALCLLIAFGQIGAPELSMPTFWTWVASQLTVFQVYNPQFLRDFGVGVVNGSLWTIPVEIGFYAILPMIVWLANRASGRPHRTLSILFVVLGLTSFAIHRWIAGHEGDLPLLYKMVKATPLAHLWLFAMGALSYLHLDRAMAASRWLNRFPLGYTYPALVYIVFRLTVGPALPATLEEMIAIPILMAGVFCLGFAAPSKAAILRGKDLSYSLYLFHMLAVNTFVALGLFGWGAIIPALTISLLAAWCSWTFVESKALHRSPAATVPLRPREVAP